MTLASELLAEPRLTTVQIATNVGYGSPFALSSAFKRRLGQSPTEFRATVSVNGQSVLPTGGQ